MTLQRVLVVTLLLTGAFLGFTPGASAQAPPPPAAGVPNVAIPGISQADFNALFPDAPICALGKLLSAASKTDDTDTLYFAGIFSRLQSATYVGTGAAAGKFAYVYQIDCTGGLGAATKVTIPFSGGGIDTAAFGAPFTYMATIHEDPAFCLSTFPSVPLFAGNLTNFNLSELGGVSGLGGTTGDGFTTAVTVGAGDVLADSGDSVFWSGSLLVVVTDRPPVVSHVTVAVHDDLAPFCFDSPTLEGSDKVVACVPTPAPPLPACDPADPVPPCFTGGEIIEPPPPANNPPEAVCRDIEVLADDHCHVHVHQEDIDGGSFDPDGDTILIHTTAVDGVPLSPPVHDFTLDGAGTHSAELTVVDDNGAFDACVARIEVIDRTVPHLECVESVNPSGNNIPSARKTNEDGFYRVSAHDNCDHHARITLGGVALADGETIKLTQSPGASGVRLVNTMGPLQIKHFIVGPGDPVITATDASGNSSSVTCLVPPPPK